MPSLVFDNVRQHVEWIESAKEEILNRWIGQADVKCRLQAHGISPEFFGHYFGVRVIDYLIGIIRGENEPGSCPVIGVMLVFFEKKNFSLEDLYTICANFRNALMGYILEKKRLDPPLFAEIARLTDRNYIGVMNEYIRIHTPQTQESSCLLQEHTQAPVVFECEEGKPALSARVYVQECGIDVETLEELAEIEEETLSSLTIGESLSGELREEVVVLFSKYAKMINRLVDFEEIGYALLMLVELLRQAEEETLEAKSVYLLIYVKAIISDLRAWRTSVFVDQSAGDIHYLDKTLLSSIAQLQIMLSPEDEPQTDEIEFF